MPAERSAKKGKKLRHTPLAIQLDEDIQEKRKLELQEKRRIRRRAKGQGDDEEGQEDDGDAGQEFLSEKMSRKILEEASKQRREEERAGRQKSSLLSRAMQEREVEEESDDEEEEEEEDGMEEEEEADSDEEDEEGDDDMVDIRDGAVHSAPRGLSEAEERVVASFMDVGMQERRTLADIIMGKIKEKEEAEAAGEEVDESSMISPKVREVYGEIAKLLKTYTAGKLPKAFKVIPSVVNWEDLLYLTRPDEWTPHATYAATRIFASNLNAKLAQRFYNLILLEKCRDDIHANRNLNYHYYMALKKALYKPGAFFKGILLPLIRSGTCTLREATIFGSVLSKVSIPVDHAAVVMLKLAQQQDYTTACSIFLKVLLNKKYTLPYRVIDAVVAYFVRFAGKDTLLPVLWHQSILVFAQRYKEEVTREGKEMLREVLKTHNHHQITPEVRRELFGSRCRGEGGKHQAAMALA